MKLNIGIAGPIGTENVADLLDVDASTLPKGYPGAPLMAVLIKELLKQGHKVSAFTTDPSLYQNSRVVRASGPNFDFYICPTRPRAWRFNKYRPGRILDGFAYERQQLVRVFKEAKLDIIHAHWTYEFALAALKTDLPHLITCHDAPLVVLKYTCSLYRAIRYLMARIVFRNARRLSTVSSYMASSVQKYTKVPIAVVPNPLADYVLALGQARSRPMTRRIGMICNGWDMRKNPKPALIAFSKFLANYPTAELHLFGAGFGVGEVCERWCVSQDIAVGMIFHGAVQHKQLIEQLSGLDLLVHPALEESFGVVIAEAMALGLPIVAGAASGAVPWVVGAEEAADCICSAVLTDVASSEAIRGAIVQAFDECYPERSESGYLRARQMFSPDVVSKSYQELYHQVMFSDGQKTDKQ
jgi:glycosyltransferase involved in cell wall biosynthesis